MIAPTQDARFGDYQANCAMPLGKRLNTPPREIAQRLVDRLDVSDLCEQPEVAGTGLYQSSAREPVAGAAAFRPTQRSKAGRGPCRPRASLRRRLFFAQHCQTDACGPYPIHRYRRRTLPNSSLPGAFGNCRQPPRRLGHSIRHDHFRLSPFWRAGRLRSKSSWRTGPRLPTRAPTDGLPAGKVESPGRGRKGREHRNAGRRRPAASRCDRRNRGQGRSEKGQETIKAPGIPVESGAAGDRRDR